MSEINSMEKGFLQQLVNAIDKHLSDDRFGVAELASELGMSRSTLHRKVREVAKKSVSTFIREIRLKRSFELLKDRKGTVSEIAYQVGFGSATYFIKCFHDFYGIPPGDVLKGKYKIPESLYSKKRNQGFLKRNIVYSVIIVIIVSLGYIFYNIVLKERSPKKIAILPPVISDSSITDNGFLSLLNENLHSDLFHLSDFAIIPKLDMERYRNTDKNSREIAIDVGTDYILQLNIFRSGLDSVIIFDLIDSKTTSYHDKDKFIFYPSNFESIENVSDKITERVAFVLNTEITPDQLKKIKTRSTTNRTAQSFYKQGLNYESLLKTKRDYDFMTYEIASFFNAVKEDSTYGDAWLKLAQLYIGRTWYTMPNLFEMEQFNIREYNNKLDSGKMMLEKAEKYTVSDPYELLSVKSFYYFDIGDFETSKMLWDEMWEHRKKDANYFLSLSSYHYNRCNYYEALKYRFKYLELVPDTSFIEIETYHGFITLLGYLTDHRDYALEFVKIKYRQDQEFEIYQRAKIPAIGGSNYEILYEYSKNLYLQDSIKPISTIFYMLTSFVLGNYEEAYSLLQERDSIYEEKGWNPSPHVYSVWLYDYFGDKAKYAEEYSRILENSIILSDTVHVPYNEKQRIYYQLAAVYSFLGEKELAYKCLEHLSDFKTIQAFLLSNIEVIPHFDDIRNEPRFQNILHDLQDKFNKEHKRIEDLLNSKMKKIRVKLNTS